MQVKENTVALSTRLRQLLNEFAQEPAEAERFRSLYVDDRPTSDAGGHWALLLQGQQDRRRRALDLILAARSHFLDQMALGQHLSRWSRSFVTHVEHRCFDERRPLEALLQLAKCVGELPTEQPASIGAPSPQAGVARLNHRQPDLETSRRRLEMVQLLSRQLTVIHEAVQHHTSVQKLKKRYSEFLIWRILPEAEQRELLDGSFLPKAYAETLTMREFGLTSKETIRKDRKKLRAHEAKRSAVPIGAPPTGKNCSNSYPDSERHTECRNEEESPADRGE